MIDPNTNLCFRDTAQASFNLFFQFLYLFKAQFLEFFSFHMPVELGVKNVNLENVGFICILIAQKLVKSCVWLQYLSSIVFSSSSILKDSYLFLSHYIRKSTHQGILVYEKINSHYYTHIGNMLTLHYIIITAPTYL